MTKVFIDGQAGTTGLKLAERLQARSDLQLIQIDEAARKNKQARRQCIAEADIAFFCLPDAAAIEAAELAEDTDTVLIDASTAHRTVPGWAYGFPELSDTFKNNIINGQRIAVPGCHASGFNAIVYPLITCGLLPKDYPIVCYSVTGYTGGGKSMIAEYEDPNRNTELDAPRQYALTQQHKHLKEMVAVNGLERTPVFAPIVADFPRGMVVSVPLFAGLLTRRATVQDVRDIFKKHYDQKPFVKVREAREDGMIGANNFAGRDDMEIEVGGNDERILVTARFDNLGKGASGAAVQCMNLVLGTDETTGLNLGE
ncbi:MAG TPA: N-acetyl-gamma-glutamyl-phosphate reductase [Candidatus Scubalenecus merdavium]|uniref:N-acetyl-gamma-glutamyl-phosphate reductase n=1 Tax=Candidatus Scybalenecus merdavium TaxID=2840939 RepID=A0A9D1MUY4_9FIRM|nr:N-acetyl-gamma-glutamyl-phosphate reductase [Candidatus Scubalenecus merdavium]